MPGFTCNACNKEFENESQRKLHYKSEWHRYNLKRKVAGDPGVTEALFQGRLSALAKEREKLNATPFTYSCTLCGKEYRSSKAHDQHLKSRSHITKASQSSSAIMTVIKPATRRMMPRKSDDSDEREEVDPDAMDETTEVLANKVHTDGYDSYHGKDDEMGMGDVEELDPTCCFVCDLDHESIESCMIHMHKQHGFFIPDVEYLNDPRGFLTYVGLKVSSLEAVRKHMIAKGHCKVRFGDGGDVEEVELEEFYDYSSSYVDADGKQLVTSDEITKDIELKSGGSELVMTKRSDRRTTVTTFGSREFLWYYRQKPRPSPSRDIALAISLASRYRSMGLITAQPKEQIMNKKITREMNGSAVEGMRSMLRMKSNITRNIPKNVSH